MKKYILGIIAFLFVFAASAYTFQSKNQPNSEKPVLQEWFEFIGMPGEENNASKYQLVTIEPDCEGGSNRCAVFAERQTGTNPVIPNLSQQYDIYTKP